MTDDSCRLVSIRGSNAMGGWEITNGGWRREDPNPLGSGLWMEGVAPARFRIANVPPRIERMALRIV